MKRIKEVICYVEHAFMGLVKDLPPENQSSVNFRLQVKNPIANAAAFMKKINERRQCYAIINSCAASVGRESLTHGKAASRNHNIFYKGFLGPGVVPHTNNLSPGPQGHSSDNTKYKCDLSLSPSRKSCLDYYIQWKHPCFACDNEDYCSGGYLLDYC